MGQKINPKAFRLVTNQKHLSTWYFNKTDYANIVAEDFSIREIINNSLKNFLVISNIEIERNSNYSGNEKNHVNIILYSLFPRVKDTLKHINNYISENFKTVSTEALENLNNSKDYIKFYTAFLIKNRIRNLIRYFNLKYKKNYYLTLKFIQNPFTDVTLIAKNIGDQLEKRIPFRRALKQTIKKVQCTDVKGIKIEISGRLNGIEIARSEWKKDGRIPLHTLSAKINYTQYSAQTIYGLIGIKVWLFSE